MWISVTTYRSAPPGWLPWIVLRRASQRRSIARPRKSIWSCHDADIRVHACVWGVILPTPERGELREARGGILKGRESCRNDRGQGGAHLTGHMHPGRSGV